MATPRGLQQLQDKVAALGKLTGRKGLEVILRYAKDNAPVRTGFLRNSGDVPNDNLLVFTADYAAFVEFGTSRQAAHPFLRPAIDEHADEAVRAIADDANDLLRKS